MARQEFDAQRRIVLGKQVKQMRRQGRVPGIVYGPIVDETVPVSVDRRDFLKFYHATGHSTLFDLRWEDGNESVFIRQVQLDPVRRDPVHIEFFAPNMRRPARAQVPLFLHNPVQVAGAVLTEIRTEVEVEALPAQIPHQIDVDVSSLTQLGDAIRAGDLNMPAGVTLVTDPDETLVQMEAVYFETEPETAEGEAAAGASGTQSTGGAEGAGS